MKRYNILAFSIVVLVSILTISVFINIQQDAEKKGLQHQLWICNLPNVKKYTIENITYHFVEIGQGVVFVSRNATEAIQWAIDYIEE